MKKFTCAAFSFSLLAVGIAHGPHATADDKLAVTTVSLKTAYLHQKLEGAHQLRLAGTLNGEGNVQLDPNKCRLNTFGDPTACTRMAERQVRVQFQRVQDANPGGQGRQLFEVIGKGFANRLFLVVPSRSDGVFRLISNNRGGPQRVVTLEPASASDEGGDKQGNAEQVGVPANADKGAGEYYALQVPGWVIVTAVGQAPTPGHKILLWQLPIEIYPPQFELLWVPPTDPTIQVLHPFRVHTRFPAADKVDKIFVHDRNGRHEVAVEPVPGAADQGAQFTPPAKADTTGSVGANGADNGKGGKGRFLPSAHVQVVTGTAERISFDKALQNAVGKLVAPFPDAQFRIQVLEIGGTHGGIAGRSTLSVTVLGRAGP